MQVEIMKITAAGGFSSTVELSRLRQLACLFAPPKTFCTYQKPFVRKKHDGQQVGFNDLFYSVFHSLINCCLRLNPTRRNPAGCYSVAMQIAL